MNKYIVKGITEIFNRSIENQEDPYYVLLLMDENGNYLIRKSSKQFEIGHYIDENNTMKIEFPTIGIIGTGVTATGIAETALMSGCKVILRGRSQESLSNSIKKIEKAIVKRVNSEKVNDIMSLIVQTTDISSLVNVDIVIEAIIEDIDIKCMIFRKLDLICEEKIILATNTSSLSIDEIAKSTKHPERVVGMHFFNPIAKMRLVEIVYTSKTTPQVIESAKKVANIFNKVPVILNNSPGFIVNRLLMSFLSESVCLLEEGLVKKEDIDMAIELGLNHPLGPIKLIDLIGLDVFQSIMYNLHSYNPSKFRISDLVNNMIKAGKLGKKVGEGFYKY